MKKLSTLVLLGLAMVIALASGCSRKQEEKYAAVPNANCQYPNQPGCWPQNSYGYGYQPYMVQGQYGYQQGYYGCQGYQNQYAYNYQPAYYPGYGMGCVPQYYMQGYNVYYQPSSYNPYYNNYYNLNTYGYNSYAIACDTAYGSQGCPMGTYCQNVGMGRVGFCSH